MKVLYIIESLTSGGKERRLISLVKNLSLIKRVEIEFVILSEDIHYEEIYNLNIKLHFLKRNLKKDLKLLVKFNRIINTFQPDIVHCWDNIAALHFGPICKFKNIPFLNSMISTAPPKHLVKLISKRFLSYAVSYPFSDVVLANSEAGLRSFRVPKSKAKCIYNGFDFKRKSVKISKKEVRCKFNIQTKFVVGMAGAFYDRKDYESFVKAGELVLKNTKDVTFVSIGDGPNLESIKTIVEDDNQVNFKFVGRQNDVESIINIFDIGILTSNMKVHGEGISNSIMEYMAFGKPVIATDGGGTNELVIDNETGYLIENQNFEQLAEKIKFLLDTPNLVSEMGQNGNNRIKDKFSMDRMVEQFLQLYKDNLNLK